MQTGLKLTLIWLILGLLFSACSSGEDETSPTPEPEAVLTAAAQTAAVQLTEQAKPQPTSTIAPPPVETGPSATAPVPVLTEGSPTSGTPQPTPITGGIDQAEFWADVTVPDGTDLNPEEGFTKVWRLRNSGTNTWTPDYSLAFFGGDQMSAPATVPISGNIPPGETTDVSVDMVAPEANGSYTGYWKMQDPAGEFFEYSVFVQIDVVGGAQAGPTSPPAQSGAGKVTKVSISVDEATPEDCPHTFTFNASFTLDKAATVSYRMEAGSETPGFTYDLPGDLTGTFDAGTHTVTYYLQIQDSVNGWARFHVLTPNDVLSNPTEFSLTCGS